LHRLISRKTGLASNILQPLDVDAQDLRRLHDASVTGRVVDEEPRLFSLAEGLPGRDDLEVTFLADEVIRISSERWPSTILVAAGSGIQNHSAFVDGATEHIVLIDPEGRHENRDSTVPLTVLNDDRLWPDFILPY